MSSHNHDSESHNHSHSHDHSHDHSLGSEIHEHSHSHTHGNGGPHPTLAFPPATAPDIIRANQKDSYVEALLFDKIQTVVRQIKGSRAVHTYNTELQSLSSFLYLAFTTILGSRTLGEEYTDLFYTTPDGSKIPSVLRRSGYAFSSALMPILALRALPKFKRRLQAMVEKRRDSRMGKVLSAIIENSPSLQTLLSVHLAIFYFNGVYYQLSKRIWGLRYFFGHGGENKQGRVGYEVLGALLLAQILFRGLVGVKQSFSSNEASSTDSPEDQLKSILVTTKPSSEVSDSHIELKNPTELAYIPEASRSCVLCLTPMTDPASTVCGHIFCWTCISEWCREKPECPLCRQSCQEQNILPLR